MICTTLIPLNVVCWTVSPSSNGKNFGGELPINQRYGGMSLVNSARSGEFGFGKLASIPDKLRRAFTGGQHSLFNSGRQRRRAGEVACPLPRMADQPAPRRFR